MDYRLVVKRKVYHNEASAKKAMRAYQKAHPRGSGASIMRMHDKTFRVVTRHKRLK